MAEKAYLLLGDIDIDLMALSGGAKSARYGADFSTAVTPAPEVHCERAHISTTTRLVLNQNGQPIRILGNATSCLLGLNYLTQSNTTFLLEYQHNGEGFQASEADAFYTLAHDAFAQFRSTGAPAATLNSPIRGRVKIPHRTAAGRERFTRFERALQVERRPL